MSKWTTFWMKALEITGYKNIEEYQNDIFPKYKDNESRIVAPPKEEFDIIEYVADHARQKQISTEDIVIFAKYYMVLVDAGKHNLDWIKAGIDLKISNLLAKYGFVPQYHMRQLIISRSTNEKTFINYKNRVKDLLEKEKTNEESIPKLTTIWQK